MAITAEQVKELREMTGAGVMDCKKILVETDGDIDKAVELLKKKGIAKAAKKADRVMHIVAANPKYVKREDVPVAVVEKEKEALKAQVVEEGKPEAIAEKIVEGRLNKFYSEICLLDQPFVKDPDKTVGELLIELIAKIGENIVIRRFVRFERGEGIEKEETNFAEEVMKQVNG